MSGKWEYMSWLLYSFFQTRSVAKRPHPLPRRTACVGVVSGGLLLTSILGGEKLGAQEAQKLECAKHDTRAVLLTCLTSTFFMTTMGDRVGKAPLAGLELGLGLSSRLQPKALSMSSDSICSAELRHSELPSAGQRNGQFAWAPNQSSWGATDPLKLNGTFVTMLLRILKSMSTFHGILNGMHNYPSHPNRLIIAALGQQTSVLTLIDKSQHQLGFMWK